MADSQNKIDAAAEKAFAEAAEKKTTETAKDSVSAKSVAKAVESDAPKPAVKPKEVAEAVAAPAKKAPAKKKPAAKKAKAKKAAPKKVASKNAKKTSTRKKAPKQTRAVAKTKAQPQTPSFTQLKDTIMAKANTDEMTKTVKEATAEMQSRFKTAYDKGSEITADITEFHKGNLEALVESGKVLASGVQDMSRAAIEDGKAAAETVTGDVKKMAAVKSPTELFQLQGEIARRNFDAAIAQASKNTEAMIKLANDAFAPLSSRASEAAEKISKAA